MTTVPVVFVCAAGLGNLACRARGQEQRLCQTTRKGPPTNHKPLIQKDFYLMFGTRRSWKGSSHGGRQAWRGDEIDDLVNSRTSQPAPGAAARRPGRPARRSSANAQFPHSLIIWLIFSRQAVSMQQ
ncbi:hypothetical protein E5198_10840 [Pseudomonas sp. A-1]|uniref:hypothetical protein n=1 Tax=Pseudomonas sp. A-1 TaxID=1821274 RepID=UPI0010A6338C|nr:hypothetical protein [Pseudomonas sp. A-1]THG81985.1 hypothetical protein E5198_10840 [Pseudomonas sp. A-1]